MKIQSSIDMFLPAVVETPLIPPSLLKEDFHSFQTIFFLFFFVICGIFSWLSLLIFIKYNRYPNFGASSVKSTVKCRYLIENV